MTSAVLFLVGLVLGAGAVLLGVALQQRHEHLMREIERKAWHP